jgi:cysteine desulfurase/selenocysteine lyase
VDYALAWGMPAIEARVTALAGTLRGALAEIPGVRVLDLGVRRCGITSFDVQGVPAEEVRRRLAAERINTSVTYATSAQYDLPSRHLAELVRASVHYFNTDEEVDALADAVRATARSATLAG